MNTPKGDVEVTITGAKVDKVAGIALGSSNLEGLVRNTTSVDIQYLQFELIYLDQHGQRLNVCDVISSIGRVCSITVFDRMPRNGSASLSYPGNVFYPGRPVPKNRTISGFVVRMMEMRYAPEYVFETKAPGSSQFSIRFLVDVAEGISFELKNELESPIEILWDQSSFINERDESSRLVHANVKFIDKDRSQPNTLVPPMAKLNETVYPSNYIRLASSEWSKTPLLPAELDVAEDASHLDALVGKSLRLFLRMMIKDEKVDYLATFTITGINR